MYVGGFFLGSSAVPWLGWPFFVKLAVVVGHVGFCFVVPFGNGGFHSKFEIHGTPLLGFHGVSIRNNGNTRFLCAPIDPGFLFGRRC